MKILTGIVSFVLLISVYMVIKNTITPKNIGVNNGELAKMPKTPNAVSSQTEDEDKKVEPLKFIGSIEESKKKVIKAIEIYGGGKIIKNERNYIYAIFTTGKMKFNDDVEFYLDEDNELIHFRSASRVGYSDMGLNRERYNKIKEIFNK